MRFFVFKQKTAYEMRISDWSSDVCSSDLDRARPIATRLANLDREPEQARGKVPRRGKLEPTRHAQAAVEVQNEAVGRKARLYDLVAKCIGGAGVHGLFPSIGRWVQLPAATLPRGEQRGVRGARSDRKSTRLNSSH